ncbi:MAG: hypothetical protein EBU20_09330 [Betaproteobacteria bacterium]|nr:hypothetical protein [Betaproteobacteria bacterium]
MKACTIQLKSVACNGHTVQVGLTTYDGGDKDQHVGARSRYIARFDTLGANDQLKRRTATACV